MLFALDHFVTGDNNPSQRELRRCKLYRKKGLVSRTCVTKGALFDTTKMALYFGRFSRDNFILSTSYLQFFTIACVGTFEPYCRLKFFCVENFLRVSGGGRMVQIFGRVAKNSSAKVDDDPKNLLPLYHYDRTIRKYNLWSCSFAPSGPLAGGKSAARTLQIVQF